MSDRDVLLRRTAGVVREMREYAVRCRAQREDIVGATVLEDWAERLEADWADDLAARVPETLAAVARIEEAKKVRRSTLDLEIDL